MHIQALSHRLALHSVARALSQKQAPHLQAIPPHLSSAEMRYQDPATRPNVAGCPGNVAGSNPGYPPKPTWQQPEKPATRPGIAQKAGNKAGNIARCRLTSWPVLVSYGADIHMLLSVPIRGAQSAVPSVTCRLA